MFNVMFSFVQARGDWVLDFCLRVIYPSLTAMHDTAILEAPAAEREVGDDAAMVDGAMIVRLRPAIKLSRKQLERFCADNRELRIEQTVKGELIIMPPTFSESGEQNASLLIEIGIWARAHGGRVFDSSAGFTLRNKAMRAPDVSWISQERYDKIPKRELRRFAKICPDFVLELRSATDRLRTLHEKMAEYIENGARLGWLIDPFEKQVFVYRPGQQIEHLQNPATLSGEPVLAGFTLDLARVW